MCLYPRIIRNKKYTSTKKNGGNIPPVQDERVAAVPVGCGRCMECKKQKANEWRVRLLEDIKTNKNGKFVTLTFSNESIRKLAMIVWENSTAVGYELDNAVATIAVRRWLERWRKKYKKSLRHWLVTELGHQGTENIHMHGIVWTDEPLTEVERVWEYGHIWKGKPIEVGGGRIEYQNYVNDRTINYTVKYVTKMDEHHKTYDARILTSPGIGNNYTKTWDALRRSYKENETVETYKTGSGVNIAMPVYWRNKIYNDDEREKLWLKKLDKQVRYVGGEKIDISKSEDEYYKALEYYRRINTKLGYGSDEKNWEKEQYERERRILKQKERIAKGNAAKSPQAGGAGNSKDIETQNISKETS